MKWFKALWLAGLYTLAGFGLVVLATWTVLPSSQRALVPTDYQGGVYQLEVGQPPDWQASYRMAELVYGYDRVYRMRLDVWEKGEQSPILFVWTSPEETPAYGFQVKGLEVRRVKGKAPPSVEPVSSGQIAVK
ncbi:MAG: hypothetical protein U1C49_02695 [Candidatus Andersenbacteria bacterium]|nr:hypothetical protein [bacterium]MDZ4225735.1 hypothetical protein [Candidatus Andersenbacteria bacterium]